MGVRQTTAVIAIVVLTLLGCARKDDGAAVPGVAPTPATTSKAPGRSQVTVLGDDRASGKLTWQDPQVELAPQDIKAARKRAATALDQGRLYEDADAAIPLYLAIQRLAPDDADAKAGLQRALEALLTAGDEALAGADEDVDALRRAHVIASVGRGIAGQDADVQAYLGRVDLADQLWVLNGQADRELRAGHLGEAGGGALAKLREALRLRPEQPRALRGMVAVESGLVDRAVAAANHGDFDDAQGWLDKAAKIRPGSDAMPAARERIAGIRRARIAQLRDEGLVALQQRDSDLPLARSKLAELLRIAEPGDAAAAQLRERIDLVAHYGLFHPGQAFTDALAHGARGPEMVVVPHGAFRMGAEADAQGASENEQPAHYIRFNRGFAMSRTEVTVGQFRHFVTASGYEPTATRRGNAFMYLERNGNFVRRGRVDWRSAYDGSRAGDDLPVLFVSQDDAQAYATWLGEQSGERYRLPSEAEFEYALRAGGKGRFPWGDGAPPEQVDNLTGSGDRSPSGRHWSNAFEGYGDGYWGPAPAGHFAANAYGLHDLAGNVSEWVTDCWHEGYRRAPDDGAAWVNPGCRTQVVRGGAWASAPEQVRTTWRTPIAADTTNARIGFRVVREL